MLSFAQNYNPFTFYSSPLQIFFTRNVKRGPISCISTPSYPSLKIYRWCLKKIKSLWLWNVTTLLPLNQGCCGKSDARSLPTLTPTFESKLFKINYGTCSVAIAWCLMFFWYSTLVILKTASIPQRWRVSNSQPFEYLKTITCVKLRFLAYLQTSSNFMFLLGQKAML